MTKQSETIKAFEDLKDQKVPEGAKAGQEGSYTAVVAKVFETYPDTVFTQRDFVDRLDISNPFVNHILHSLMKKGIVSRVGSSRKYYYSYVAKKAQ
jgi:hypothetical protein